ncbi:MAG: helix-turn-helix domain-containing protein [Burkholderiales bacterium]|nr:helix-turn-helix domain-containing protein [Burkholderiales bacterium]
MNSDLMTIEQVSELLKITARTARNRLSRGDPMPPSFRTGRRRLFLTRAVQQWIEEQACMGFAELGDKSQMEAANEVSAPKRPGRPRTTGRGLA